MFVFDQFGVKESIYEVSFVIRCLLDSEIKLKWYIIIMIV